jgi:hypothetical protein
MSDGTKPSISYIWPFIGLGLGTAVVGSLVLSTDARERFIVGLIVGGIPFGLIGLWYAVYRRNRISD